MNQIEATLQLAQAIQRLAQAIHRYCDLQELPPKTAKPAVVSSATYDRKQTQAEREMHQRFGAAQAGPPAQSGSQRISRAEE